MVDYDRQDSDRIEQLINLFPEYKESIPQIYQEQKKKLEEEAIKHPEIEKIIPNLVFKNIRDTLNKK